MTQPQARTLAAGPVASRPAALLYDALLVVGASLFVALCARVTLPLGGKLDMPALGLKGKPRKVTGNVRRIVNGIYRNEGPMARGELADMGPSAVLDTGKVEIAVISRHVEPHDIASFRALGIDPARKRYVMLKSRVHWRAGLGPMARAVVECAGEGVCTSDYSQLKFRRVRRPVYPLDPETPPAAVAAAS